MLADRKTFYSRTTRNSIVRKIIIIFMPNDYDRHVGYVSKNLNMLYSGLEL